MNESEAKVLKLSIQQMADKLGIKGSSYLNIDKIINGAKKLGYKYRDLGFESINNNHNKQ